MTTSPHVYTTESAVHHPRPHRQTPCTGERYRSECFGLSIVDEGMEEKVTRVTIGEFVSDVWHGVGTTFGSLVLGDHWQSNWCCYSPWWSPSLTINIYNIFRMYLLEHAQTPHKCSNLSSTLKPNPRTLPFFCADSECAS